MSWDFHLKHDKSGQEDENMLKDKSPFHVGDFNVYEPMAGNVDSKAPWWLYGINPFLVVGKL